MTKAKRTTRRGSRATPLTAKVLTSAPEGVDEAVSRAVDDVVDETVERLGKPARSRATTVPVDARSLEIGKQEVVSDRFKMPKSEYDNIDLLKKRCSHLSRSVKKSELLRAGMAALTRMSDAQLLAAVGSVSGRRADRTNGTKA